MLIWWRHISLTLFIQGILKVVSVLKISLLQTAMNTKLFIQFTEHNSNKMAEKDFSIWLQKLMKSSSFFQIHSFFEINFPKMIESFSIKIAQDEILKLYFDFREFKLPFLSFLMKSSNKAYITRQIWKKWVLMELFTRCFFIGY